MSFRRAAGVCQQSARGGGGSYPAGRVSLTDEKEGGGGAVVCWPFRGEVGRANASVFAVYLGDGRALALALPGAFAHRSRGRSHPRQLHRCWASPIRRFALQTCEEGTVPPFSPPKRGSHGVWRVKVATELTVSTVCTGIRFGWAVQRCRCQPNKGSHSRRMIHPIR